MAGEEMTAPPVNLFISRAGQGALLWIELTAATGFVGFRTYIQYRHNKKLFSNDYLILAALTLHFCSAVISQLMIPPMYDVQEFLAYLSYGMAPPGDFPTTMLVYLKYQFAVCITFWCTLWAVKFSLLLFFWRLFDSLHTRMRIFWWCMMIVTAATLITTIFLQLFACGTPGSFFKLGEEGCSTKRDIYMSNLVFLFSAGTDIACDVFLIFIPFPLLWKLQVSQRQRIILVVIFLLPLIPICFGILRLVFCNPTAGTVDVVKFTFYFMLENTAAIITACLPSMRLFFLQKSGTTIAQYNTPSGGRPSQNPYGTASGNGLDTKKSIFSTATATITGHRSSKSTGGAIPLTDLGGADGGAESGRDSEESRTRILGKSTCSSGGGDGNMGRGLPGGMQVVVTREFSVNHDAESLRGGSSTGTMGGGEVDGERVGVGKAW